MPHLSPLNWLLTPIFMMLILFLLIMILWWQNNPLFPMIKSFTHTSMSKKWYWW